ncbi:tyrosine-protein phosphatase YwqE [Paenibacillus baekrokdamisoli]|uniref:Tyrosine-protein phosphatase n=1 Tax=Paenibacillus baekrokdamisoli TaxID=1712516 RepID=A0A3G9J926_9BACL|nr:CpsB/CapC family capsule biosynthesis tyrosine phosphatase [Paenibacillus baekrokdamisoli]MBB3067252.1 protein-tyrosine phosphatase [Paenibacillus baekrokdamisoli]BBH19559.1 tyrosine-protein phosphatase YwqE [Paenibacillus baekrokdamisoli]
MIDIHCHLLPGLDDGPVDMQHAILLARSAVRDGVTTVIATPHYRRGVFDTNARLIRQSAAQLNAELKIRHIPLRVMTGQEIRVHDQLLEELEAGRLLPLGQSSNVLLELPSSRIPERFEDLLHELRIAGWTPVIAHPERNTVIASDPDKLAIWVNEGALCQLTSHSLTGRFGNKVKAAAWELCRRNLIHFIASDAHNETSRPCELKMAYELVSCKLGSTQADYYMRNARSISHNMPIVRKPTQPRRRALRFFAGWSLFKGNNV